MRRIREITLKGLSALAALPNELDFTPHILFTIPSFSGKASDV